MTRERVVFQLTIKALTSAILCAVNLILEAGLVAHTTINFGGVAVYGLASTAHPSQKLLDSIVARYVAEYL